MSDLSALKPLIGRWATTIKMLHPSHAAGQRYSAVDTYRWMGGQSVVVHDVQAKMFGTIVNSIEIYTLQGGCITARSYDSSGDISDYKAGMTSDEWKIEGASQRFASTKISSEVIEGVWQLKVDANWVDWMTVHLERIATA